MEKKIQMVVAAASVFVTVACVISFGGLLLGFLTSQDFLTKLALTAGGASSAGAASYVAIKKE